MNKNTRGNYDLFLVLQPNFRGDTQSVAALSGCGRIGGVILSCRVFYVSSKIKLKVAGSLVLYFLLFSQGFS